MATLKIRTNIEGIENQDFRDEFAGEVVKSARAALSAKPQPRTLTEYDLELRTDIDALPTATFSGLDPNMLRRKALDYLASVDLPLRPVEG